MCQILAVLQVKHVEYISEKCQTRRRSRRFICSDLVLETKVLVSRRLEDKRLSLGLGLGLETQSLGLGLGLEVKVLVLVLVLTKKS